jgi:SOS-response transcriptional repressor LexA
MENHNWAAVIPCKYLLAKDITSTQKLIIGLISSLSNLKGYCYAGNEYFAECLTISKIRVSQSITDLEHKGYITRIIKRNERNEIEQRIIKLVIDNDNTLLSKIIIPPIENDNTLPLKIIIPPIENFKENKKFNNNINNKNNKVNIPTLEEVINYFIEKGSTEEKGKQAFEYYEAGNWHDAKGNKVKSWKQKMLAVWINNNNFNKQTTKNETRTKQTNIDYYKQSYEQSLKWANDWENKG